MKLIDLEPRWIDLQYRVFVFKCPHCPETEWLLSCKSVVMSEADQHRLFEKEFGENWNTFIVPCKEGTVWSFSFSRPMQWDAAFPTDMTVEPSIDGSNSGHWHGHVKNGEIV